MTVPADIVILGSGSTAMAAALRGAERGARVLMVEQSEPGGTCVNWGCIPSKTLIDKARIQHQAEDALRFGLNIATSPPDCGRLMAAKRAAVEVVKREGYLRALESDPRITLLRGHGRFLSSRELQVGAEVVVAERFLIACGGFPRTLRLPGLTEIDYLTSYSALHLACFPRSLMIVGGGVIAVEMGQMFARFGTEVAIFERGERLLKDFDARLSGLIQKTLEDEGLRVVCDVEPRRLHREGDNCCLTVMIDEGEREYRAERLMFAVGTAPATEGIGLDVAGVALREGGFIAVDEEMRTSAEGIWAAGDCTGPPLIAPAGAREGEVAVDNMLEPSAHRRIDHRLTPMAVFTDPELARVGISSEAAKSVGREVDETFFDLARVAKSHVMGGKQGGILLTVERYSDRILGVEMLAPRAADVIHESAIAVRCGLTAHDLTAMVHVYPTVSDGLRLAALEHLRYRGDREQASRQSSPNLTG